MTINVPKGFEISDFISMNKRNKLNKFLAEFLENNGYLHSNVSDIMRVSSIPPSYKSNVDYTDSFKFMDNDGSLLFMPKDVMPLIMIATRLSKEVPLRLFSIKDCYSFLDCGIRNLSQIGAMHYGIDNVAAEAEAICMAEKLAKMLNLTNYTININDTRILSGIVKVYTRHDVTKSYIKNLLKNESKNEMDNACVTMLSSVANAVGKITDIKFIADKIDNKESVSGLYNLLNLSELLEEYECENNVTYHTGFLGVNDYEDGFVFNLVCDNQVILHGGRYVYNIDGETLFGIGIKFIYPAISKAFFALDDADGKNNPYDVVLGTSSSNLSLIRAYKLKGTFIDSNLKVNVLYNKTMEEVKEYAKKFGIQSVIFVDNQGNLEYI